MKLQIKIDLDDSSIVTTDALIEIISRGLDRLRGEWTTGDKTLSGVAKSNVFDPEKKYKIGEIKFIA